MVLRFNKVFSDHRGWFFESWNQHPSAKPWKQWSSQDTTPVPIAVYYGTPHQLAPEPQAKLVRAISTFLML